MRVFFFVTEMTRLEQVAEWRKKKTKKKEEEEKEEEKEYEDKEEEEGDRNHMKGKCRKICDE